MNKNRGLLPLTAVLMLSGTLMLTGCEEKQPQQQTGQQAKEVDVVTLKAAPLAITTELPGRTSAFRIAEVRPQVSGIILKRQFEEGSEIKAGESLYQIDPATYQATYNSAKGDLAKAEANAQLANLTVKRYQPLLKTNYISRQDYDTAVSTARQAEATVTAAKAALENARINLAYTKVTSPISGRIGKSNVTEGALVTASQTTALATVQQLDKLYVDVTQSSVDFTRLKKELADGTLKQIDGKASVTLLLENGSEYEHKGTLEFSDVTVDETTGSITLRAIVPNPDQTLLPGMFVRARLDEGVKQNAILVPQRGVTRNPRGQATAMIVNPEGQVETRIIEVGQAVGDQWLLTGGLKEGDKVIITTTNLRDKMPVTPKEYSPSESQPNAQQQQ